MIGEQPAAAGVMVHSQIVKANGEPVNVDYMMCCNGNVWLISTSIRRRDQRGMTRRPNSPRS